MINKLSKEILENLSEARIKKYHRIMRTRFYAWDSSNFCECCGEPNWGLYDKSDKLMEKEKNKYYEDLKEWKSYLKIIEKIANKFKK